MRRLVADFNHFTWIRFLPNLCQFMKITKIHRKVFFKHPTFLSKGETSDKLPWRPWPPLTTRIFRYSVINRRLLSCLHLPQLYILTWSKIVLKTFEVCVACKVKNYFNYRKNLMWYFQIFMPGHYVDSAENILYKARWSLHINFHHMKILITLLVSFIYIKSFRRNINFVVSWFERTDFYPSACFVFL